MEQLHTDSAGPDSDYSRNEEPLSDYVKRMETDENLRKLAQKLHGDLKKPTGKKKPGEPAPDVSTPDVSTPDVSFDKFEEKLKRRND